MALNRVACALPVIAALSSQGLAADVCLNGTGECEEVGLLQQATQSVRKHALPGSSTQCDPPCQNGVCMLPLFNYCDCHPGWSGSSCSLASECDVFVPKPHDDSDDEEKCKIADPEIFPYSQEKLWGTAYNGLGWQGCSGRFQSPINIVCLRAKFTSGPKLDQHFGTSSESPDHVENNGHSLQVNGDFGPLKIGDVMYETSQFHFHHPSEHAVDFKHFAMEMHIVTSSKATNKTAVIGIFLDIGKPNTCLEGVFRDPAPTAVCEKQAGNIDLSCFESQLSGPYWSYTGSLTTPPCTEGVSWTVMKLRSTVSLEQLDVFKTRYLNNARPVKPLNGRRVISNEVKKVKKAVR